MNSNGLDIGLANGRFDNSFVGLANGLVGSEQIISEANTFIFTIRTTSTRTLDLPLVVGGTYNFWIDWGDGKKDYISSYNQTNSTHLYPTALRNEYPIRLNFCPEGVFVQRKNEVEAEKIARAIEKQLLIASDSIGVVAFSQEQLSCIWEYLSSESQEKISENLDTGKGFFKTLEQVQGEECEHLFISIGYGKNEVGKFQLRMGPLNRRNGYRRLNVLFTRAQKMIHLFTSVTASDFPITDNESIQLLRLYLQDAAQIKVENVQDFPYALTPSFEKYKQIKFDSIYDTLNQADELLNFHQVMQNRGWLLNY